MVHVASISGRRSPTFDGMHRMGPLFPTLFEKRPRLSPGYVKRVTISRGIAVDLPAWWRLGSVKRWPLSTGLRTLRTGVSVVSYTLRRIYV